MVVVHCKPLASSRGDTTNRALAALRQIELVVHAGFERVRAGDVLVVARGFLGFLVCPVVQVTARTREVGCQGLTLPAFLLTVFANLDVFRQSNASTA
jgi:hypothetical protein